MDSQPSVELKQFYYEFIVYPNTAFENSLYIRPKGLYLVCYPQLSASLQAGLSFGLEFRLDIHKSIILILGYSLPTARHARLQVSSSKPHNDIKGYIFVVSLYTG